MFVRKTILTKTLPSFGSSLSQVCGDREGQGQAGAGAGAGASGLRVDPAGAGAGASGLRVDPAGAGAVASAGYKS